MYAVIRIRGTIGARREIRDTLKMLNLLRINSCTIIPETPSYKGMLQKVKDYVTWGEASDETLALLLKRNGVENVEEAIKKLKEGVKLKDITNPCIRLHPPRKGYKSIKKPFSMGGSAGYRGDAINELVRRMI
ncbi:MAG: uL30 family ribosomal protein [Thermoplasmata archaeon]|nr:uL30 family ribosomal protein [Thermoplasmata archaeon]